MHSILKYRTIPRPQVLPDLQRYDLLHTSSSEINLSLSFLWHTVDTLALTKKTILNESF